MTTINLVDVITDGIRAAFEMSEGAAVEMAGAIIRAAAARGHAGADYYLPRLGNMTREERNAHIRREFNGSNLKEVCRKYGVKKSTVYEACRRCS